MTATAPIRVVVVEDSATQRAFLRKSIERDGDIVIVGEAGSALSAVAAVENSKPDVVTMDLNIPGGGVAAIERIMSSTPRPILLLSGQIGGPRSPAAVDALGAGAVGVLAKPLRWDAASEQVLRGRIRALRRVRAGFTQRSAARPQQWAPARRSIGIPILAIGASTGGPAALARVLRDIKGLNVPVVCVQHIDTNHVTGLTEWLSRSSGWDVRVAAHGDVLQRGVVLVGPGGTHLTVDRGGRVALVRDASALHCPSANRLFASLAESAGERTVAVLLTGMGNDGADGMLAVQRAGGATIVQDEASSAVYGMAKAAVELGAVRRIIALDTIGTAIARALRGLP